ncbi:MAG: hypothetical protein WA021_02325 [Minisyncoccia bacterium]
MDETTPAAQPSSTKKWLLIGGGIVLLLIIGSVVTGFGRGTGFGSAYFTPGVDVDQNIDGTTTYTNEEGSVTVGAGAGLPDNWPSDAPQPYTGAEILYSGTSNPATGAAGSAMVYSTSASAQSVIEYYNSRLRAEGWDVQATSVMAGMTVLSATKDTRTFGVYAADDGQGKTSVTVGVEM